MSDRSPDNHPYERITDKSVTGRLVFWWGPGRGYRDIWLLIITIFVYIAVHNTANQTNSIQQNRISQVADSCKKSNQTTIAVNDAFRTLQLLVVAGSAAPGDIPMPRGEINPLKWTYIKAGPLSKTVSRTIPGYPGPTARLKLAKRQAATLNSKKVPLRNCKAEIAAIKSSK